MSAAAAPVTARALWASATRLERFTAAFALPYGVGIWLTGGHRPAAALAIAGDAALAATVLAVLPRLRQTANVVARYFGVALPLAAFYALYLQSGLVDVSAVHWRDADLLRLQQLVLPSVPLIRSVAVRGWFVAAYFVYPVMLPLGVLALLLPWSPAHQDRAGDAVRRICYSFAGCYVLALLLPALSPRFFTPELQRLYLGDGLVSELGAVAQGAMVVGSSFPSAHLAATTTLLWDIWYARRPLFWILVPICLSMTAGTVLFLYHYVPDVIAGIAVGAAAVAVDHWPRRVR